MAFVVWAVWRSGHVAPATTAGTFRNAGNEGNWWSSRGASSATNAYDLNFNTAVYPSHEGNRYVGRSLRWFLPRWGADLSYLELFAVERDVSERSRVDDDN